MFYDNLSRICKARKTYPSAVLVALGMSKSNVTNWKSGQAPKIETVNAIADYPGVSFWDLIEDGQQKTTDTKDGGVTELKDVTLVRFPIIGTISAGYSCLAVEEYTGDYELIPIKYLHGSPDDYFVLRVKGDSMYPRLLEGDSVLVHKASIVPNGKVAVVQYNGEEATIKRVEYKEGKYIDIIPYNPEYKTKRIEGVDLNECHILGEIERLIRKM